MSVLFPHLNAARYQRHLLHGPERQWPQTNCYVDLWIELLASCQMEPRAMLGFTLTQDFEGDQFTFFKVPLEDLEFLYALKVQELAIYERLEGHITTQLERGRCVLVEVDGYYLPDTMGVSYRQTHPKTTIAINLLEEKPRRLGYFHNDGYFELDGEDYDGLFGHLEHQKTQEERLFPYVEFVKFPEDEESPLPRTQAEDALHLLRHHYHRRPVHNPIKAYQLAFGGHLDTLLQKPVEAFHLYTFNTLRQMGANFELLGSNLSWLQEQEQIEASRSIKACETIAAGAKTLQFQLARAVARQKAQGLEVALDPMIEAYDLIMEDLDALED